MNTTQKTIFSLIFSAALIGVSLVSSAVFAQSATRTDSGSLTSITYPIVELGNCTDRASCKVYCADVSHASVCIAFGKSHNLITSEQGETTQKIADSLLKSSGPGGCPTPAGCETYCAVVAHVGECVAFAKVHALKAPKLVEANKLATYISSGGETPGSCTDAASCKLYCADLTHFAECQNFSKTVGLTGDREGTTTPSMALKKFTDLVAAGKTPGGCTTTEQCKMYCADPNHQMECVAFAKSAGLISNDQGEKLRTLNGKGPGQCSSAISCEQYCNTQEHRDECFAFARNNGLIASSTVAVGEKILVSLRTGIVNASPEIAACLDMRLGTDTVNAIVQGTITPGGSSVERARACFEKLGTKIEPTAVLKALPPGILSCVKEKLGTNAANVLGGKTALTPEMADVVRVCHDQSSLSGNDQEQKKSGTTTTTAAVARFLDTAPVEVRACLREKLGDKLTLVASGQLPTSAIKDKAAECFKNFMMPPTSKIGSTSSVMRTDDNTSRIMPPSPLPRRTGDKEEHGTTTTPRPVMMQVAPGTTATSGRYQLPAGVGDCVRANISVDEFQALVKGAAPSPSEQAVIVKCYMSLKANTTSSSGAPSGVQPGMPTPPPPSVDGERRMPTPLINDNTSAPSLFENVANIFSGILSIFRGN